MQTRITPEEMQAAARQLAKTPHGRAAMEQLLGLFQSEALRLDLLDQRAFLALLGGAWAGQSDKAREVITSTLATPSAGR